MNPELLKKLQAQKESSARIGGKVRTVITLSIIC